jgi:gliding motility-associated lipoprotein GldD
MRFQNPKIQHLAVLFFLVVTLVFTSCGDPVFAPKPRVYPRIDFPAAREYKPFDANYCGFTFDQPAYTTIVQDTSFFGDKPENACWFDVYYPMFNGRVHFSYKQIKSQKDFEKMLGDAHQLTGKHTIKADGIDEIAIKNPNGVGGIVFDVQGSVASPFQFYLTDSTRNFVRGALYFKSKANADSLQPVVEFVKTDMMRMVESFKWKK